MKCSITGQVKRVFDRQQVTEKFSKREVLIEEPDDKYPHQLIVEFCNKDIDKLNGICVGQTVECEFSVNSRPSRDGSRYFTSARGVSIKADPASYAIGMDAPIDLPPPPKEYPVADDEGLPF